MAMPCKVVIALLSDGYFWRGCERAMAMPCKVSISALVVVGAKEILNSGRMYDESVDVKAIISMAMDKAAAQRERSMCFVKAEAYTACNRTLRVCLVFRL